MRCDYPCVSLNTTSPSAFTFLALRTTERLFGCNMKEQVQIVEALVVPHEADQWLAVKHFVGEDSTIPFIVINSSFKGKCSAHLALVKLIKSAAVKDGCG